MIREMTAQDEKRYLDMGQEFYSSNAVLHPIPREIYHKNFQEMLQGSPYIKGYIIEKDGQTAGYMILSFTYSSEVGGMVVLIEELFLHENFRGCGLGTEALDFVRKQFPHADRFRLEVTPDNGGAARLYARKGFEPLDYRQMVIDPPAESR